MPVKQNCPVGQQVGFRSYDTSNATDVSAGQLDEFERSERVASLLDRRF